mgnify:CR=1 FL=1
MTPAEWAALAELTAAGLGEDDIRALSAASQPSGQQAIDNRLGTTTQTLPDGMKIPSGYNNPNPA